MSTYQILWMDYQQKQNTAALVLGLLGVGLALGWLMIGEILPVRCQPAARWGYLALCLLLGGLAVKATL